MSNKWSLKLNTIFSKTKVTIINVINIIILYYKNINMKLFFNYLDLQNFVDFDLLTSIVNNIILSSVIVTLGLP